MIDTRDIIPIDPVTGDGEQEIKRRIEARGSPKPHPSFNWLVIGFGVCIAAYALYTVFG
jgi:hypothetical protein